MSHRTSLFWIALVLLGLSAHVAGQGTAQDYPQWRGQTRDGSASALTAPESWPEALTHRWTVEVGEGYATPLVVGSRVYTFTRQHGDEVATALDAATGTVIWQTSYAAPYDMFAATAAHGEGPKATPLFHNGMIYTHGISGTVSAFDAATGHRVWQVPAPDEPPFYGAAVSPIADGDLVILHPGYGPLTAFEADTGDVHWTADDGGFFASPIITTLAGTRQLVTVTLESLIGVSVADGEVLWQYPWDGAQGSPTPVVDGDTVLISGLNQGVAAVRPRHRDGDWAVDTVWTTTDVSMYLSTPVLVDRTLFGLSHRASGQFFALDARTGDMLWLGEPRQAENTAIVTSADLLLLLNDDAELIVARSSTDAFEPLRRYTVAESATWAQPAISGDRIYVKDVTSLTLWALGP